MEDLGFRLPIQGIQIIKKVAKLEFDLDRNLLFKKQLYIAN